MYIHTGTLELRKERNAAMYVPVRVQTHSCMQTHGSYKHKRRCNAACHPYEYDCSMSDIRHTAAAAAATRYFAAVVDYT